MTARADSAPDALCGSGYAADNSIDRCAADSARGRGCGARYTIDRFPHVADCPSDDTHDDSLGFRSLSLQTALATCIPVEREINSNNEIVHNI
jgi:hypothetical protein